MNASDKEVALRMRGEFEDSFDQELELEIEDRNWIAPPDSVAAVREPIDRVVCRQYFRDLLGLQAELIRWQDWVVSAGHRLVIVFEERDAAGKAASSSASRSG